MGIVKFYSRFVVPLRKGYPNLISHNVAGYVNSLSIDVNSILHSVAAKVFAYGDKYRDEKRQEEIFELGLDLVYNEYENTLYNSLNTVITLINPQQLVVLAVDGLPPLAKIWQQRQRRYYTMLEYDPKKFDTNNITTGTDFMRKIDVSLNNWCKQLSNKTGLKVIYSSHLQKGEGEHKIMNMIRDRTISGNGAHIIYGLDSDLIVLSMLAPINNIYLFHTNELDMSNVEKVDVLSIDIFRRIIIEKLNPTLNLYRVTQKELAADTSLTDFCIIMSLLGNDFLPAVFAFDDIGKSLEFIFSEYVSFGLSLTNNQGIQWNNLQQFIYTLSIKENTLLIEKSNNKVKYPSKLLSQAKENDEFNIDKFRNIWYTNALGNRGDNFVSGNNITIYDITTMAREYASGIGYILNYYLNGENNINLAYSYNYFHAPMLEDIYKVMDKDIGLLNNRYNYNTLPKNFSVLHQLISVIPPTSSMLLPDEIKGLMDYNGPLADLFPLGLQIERDGVDTDYQKVIYVPPIPLLPLMEIMELYVDPKEIKKNYVRNVVVYKGNLSGMDYRNIIYNNLINNNVVEFLTPELQVAKNVNYKQHRKKSQVTRGGIEQTSNTYRGRGNFRGSEGNYRGSEGSNRGREGNYRGREGNYRGREGNYRGREGNYRGREGNYRGREGNYRGRGGYYREETRPEGTIGGFKKPFF